MNIQHPRGRIALSTGLSLLIFLLLNTTALAEPYLAVFKGMHCSSCHVHPAGGGKRNLYGTTFAQVELPVERIGGDDAPFWTGELNRWLSVGANLRGSYRSVDTPNSKVMSAFDVTRGTLYVEGTVIPGRLNLYIDQQVAPGASLNREAYVKLTSANQKLNLTAGQFFLPYGLRLQDDTAFVRQVTGINFTNPDRGVQFGYQSGPWATQLSVTNGTGGSPETDTGKQLSLVASFVRPGWRAGISLNSNDDIAGDRQMGNVFAGLKTGPIVWLAEADFIQDEIISRAVDRDGIAGLVEGNWLFRRGHNLKVSYEYFDPDRDIREDHQVRWSVVWEHSPIQFLQGRFGARVYDGIPQINAQNRREVFAELHGFF